MTQNLNNFLKTQERQKYATQNGTKIHAQLQNVIVDDVHGCRGDADIIDKIKQNPNLCKYFCANAKTEVPIAGILNGIFVSRRIDRLLINNATKTIFFIDYKTDTNKTAFIDKYQKQLKEYAQLLRSAYPEHQIYGGILWLCDWQLQQIISL